MSSQTTYLQYLRPPSPSQGYALGEVARYFARDATTVGTLIGRLAKAETLRREIDRLYKKVEK